MKQKKLSFLSLIRRSLPLLLWLLPTAVFAQFQDIAHKVQYLGFMRRDTPELYQDFITRYDAIAFLDTTQSAIDHLHFQKTEVDGKEFSVFDSDETGAELATLNDVQFRSETVNFVNTYSQKNGSLKLALQMEFSREAMIDGLTVGLMQSNAVPQIREIMQLEPHARILALSAALENVEVMKGLDPRRVGIDAATFSGRQFISYYKDALLGQYSSVRLLWLAAAVGIEKGLDLSVVDAETALKSMGTSDLETRFSADEFRVRADAVIDLLLKLPGSPLNSGRLKKFIKTATSALKPFTSRKSLPVLIETRAHPFAVLPRGSVGDCSTANCPTMSLAGKEEYYWIKDRNLKIRGYLQYTRLKVNGEDAIYINTISGSGLAQVDVRRALFSIAASLPKLNARHLIIPVPEKYYSIINFPEVATVLREIAAQGTRVKLDYLDAEDRLNLAPFTEDSLDLPETNKFGMNIPVDILLKGNFRVEEKDVHIGLKDIFPELRPDEVLLVALDLRNHSTTASELRNVLQHYHWNPETFEELWTNLGNPEKLPVELFHNKVRAEISKLHIKVSWDSFKNSPLLFRGHMLAPDALSAEHLSLTLDYVRVYLQSLTDLSAFYDALAPHLVQLAAEKKFVAIVQGLFKKNIKDFDRLLDYYEIGNRSAYRTLARLFLSGLPTAPFQSEIAQLNQPWEDKQETKEQQAGIFFRRTTLLGMIQGYPQSTFQLMMDHLRGMAANKDNLGEDDVRTVGRYLADFIQSKNATAEDVHQINKFLMGSPLGISFTPQMGLFKIDRLDVPAIMERLFSIGQFKAAAYMIHKGNWPKHPLASYWMTKLAGHYDDIGHDLFLQGLKITPSWLDVPGVNPILDKLMADSRGNISDETILTNLLLAHPQKLTPERRKWLAAATTKDLSAKIKTAIGATAVSSTNKCVEVFVHAP